VRFPAGTRVRARPVDPDHHTRLPRYVRGHVGTIAGIGRERPLPDDIARGVLSPRVEVVYAVQFASSELWGAGAHAVTVELWESYLEEIL
jgi:hypothetical protein